MNIFELNEFPKLTSNRLILRKLLVSDIPSLIRNVNNPKISDQIINIPYPYLEEDAIFRLNFIYQAFKNKERYIFAINENNSSEVIGEIGIHLDKSNNKAEVGYWIAESHWNKGYASESLQLILKFGFEQLKLNKIIATHYLDNLSSEKVLIKNGMIKEGQLNEHYKINDKYLTVNQYRLTKSEYLNNISTTNL